MTTLTLIGRAGCHLCDDARAIVLPVAAEFGIPVVERSLDDDPALARFRDDIPVLLIDEDVHARWWVHPDGLRAALTAAGSTT